MPLGQQPSPQRAEWLAMTSRADGGAVDSSGHVLVTMAHDDVEVHPATSNGVAIDKHGNVTGGVTTHYLGLQESTSPAEAQRFLKEDVWVAARGTAEAAVVRRIVAWVRARTGEAQLALDAARGAHEATVARALARSRAAQRGEDVRIAEEELAEMLADEAEEDADGEAEENAVAAAVGDEVAPLEPAVALVQRVSSSQVAKTHATLMRTVAALGAAQEIIFLGEEALGAVARGGG